MKYYTLYTVTLHVKKIDISVPLAALIAQESDSEDTLWWKERVTHSHTPSTVGESRFNTDRLLRWCHTLTKLSRTNRWICHISGWSCWSVHTCRQFNYHEHCILKCWHIFLVIGKAQGWGLDLRVENDTQRKLADLSVDWILFGRHDQVKPDRCFRSYCCGLVICYDIFQI